MSNNIKKTLLFIHYENGWNRSSEICLINLIKNINHQKYNCILWCNQQYLADKIQKQIIASYITPFTVLLGWQSPRFSLSNWHEFYQQGKDIIHRHHVDLIHCNSAVPCQWMNLVARHTHTPLVTHLHAQYSLRDRLSLGLHFSPKLITVSDAVGQNLLLDGYKERNITIVPNGINTKKLNAQKSTLLREQLNIDKSAFVLATSGSLIYRKGIDLIIESLHKLDATSLNLHLVIIGDGEEKTNLESQVEQLKLTNNVHFLGEQCNVVGLLKSDINAYINGARDEAFGLALVEASLAQLPVIAPMVGGIPEVISHYETGLLTQVNDSDSFAKAIMVLMNNPYLANRMGRRGKETVYRHFTLSHYTQQFEHIYEKQLSTTTKSRYSRPFWQTIQPLLSNAFDLFFKNNEIK